MSLSTDALGNLPHGIPPEGTVRDYFHQWRRNGIWDKIHDTLREKVRVTVGREPTPSAGSVDSQSLKSARTAGVRGFDAGKKSTESSGILPLTHWAYDWQWSFIPPRFRIEMEPNWSWKG